MIFNNTENKPFSTAAQVLSIVIHPLTVPTFIYGVLAWTAPQLLLPYQNDTIIYFLLLTLLTTWLIPGLAILGLYNMRLIDSWLLDSRADRTLTVGIVSILYAATAWFLHTKLRANHTILLIFVGIIASQIISAVITLYWKISMHMVAAGGALAYMAMLSLTFELENMLYPFLVGVALTGLLGSARLYLGMHTIHQIYAGLLLGLGIGITVVLLF